MIIFRFFNIVITFIFITFSISKISAQDKKNEVSLNPKFEQLLLEKRKINNSITIDDSFKIQIFIGTAEFAKKTLNEFRQEFKSIDATIVFNTPNYKVWVGNFRTRIEAEKNIIEIKKKFTNAFLIKPSR